MKIIIFVDGFILRGPFCKSLVLVKLATSIKVIVIHSNNMAPKKENMIHVSKTFSSQTVPSTAAGQNLLIHNNLTMQ